MGREVSINVFVLTLLLSILIHIFIAYQVRLNEAKNPITEQASNGLKEFEITQLPTTQAKRFDDGSDGPAHHSSEHRNRTKKETSSPRVGQYKDSFSPNQPSEKDQSNKVDEFGQAQAPFTHQQWSQLFQVSQSPYKLDGLEKSDETVLNTDAVSYAGFLNRLADSIYPVWVAHLKEASNVYVIEHRDEALSDGPFITRLGIEMDKAGTLLSVQVLKSSGVRVFDEAPKLAFWDQEPFRHPPSQLFAQGEPTVRFVYEFHFERKSSIFSILKNRAL